VELEREKNHREDQLLDRRARPLVEAEHDADAQADKDAAAEHESTLWRGADSPTLICGTLATSKTGKPSLLHRLADGMRTGIAKLKPEVAKPEVEAPAVEVEAAPPVAVEKEAPKEKDKDKPDPLRVLLDLTHAAAPDEPPTDEATPTETAATTASAKPIPPLLERAHRMLAGEKDADGKGLLFGGHADVHEAAHAVKHAEKHDKDKDKDPKRAKHAAKDDDHDDDKHAKDPAKAKQDAKGRDLDGDGKPDPVAAVLAHEGAHADAKAKGKAGADPTADTRLDEIDARGDARPDVGGHANAIERLANDPIDADHEDDRDAGDVDHDQLGFEPLGEIADVAQLDSAVAQRKQQVQSQARGRETKVQQRVHKPQRQQRADANRTAVQQQGQRASQVQHKSVEQAKQRKVLSKDELRTKLTTATDAKKKELEDQTKTKTEELDTKLAAQLKKLLEEQKKQDDKLVKELDARVVKLEADIAKRKGEHDKQIAKQRVDLDNTDKAEQEKLRATAKADADKIKAEAKSQADTTFTNAQTKATETTAKGETEAGAATRDAEAKAQQAISAAEGRAKALEGDEASKVRAEGTSRAAMARQAGTSKAASIRSKAAADAGALRDKGKADQAKQLADGETRAAKAIQNGEDQAAKVHAKTLESIAAMQAKSDDAVKQMTAEVDKMKADVAAKRIEIALHAVTGTIEVALKLEADKAKAAAEIQKEHDKALQLIETKVTADLAKIDAANDKDLAKLERQVDADIREINAAVKRAETNIDRQVQAAERKAAATVQAEKAKIQSETAKVIGSLDRQAAQARQRIAAADKNTKKDIKAAHDAGVTAVAATAKQAETDLSSANAALLKETQDQGAADRAAADKIAADSAKAMEDSRNQLGAEINKQWVDDAVKKANSKLDDNGIFNVVTDEEATEAMNLLNSLPDDVQGDAIKGLDKAAFENLLDEVPENRREEFKSLVVNTHDPELKLKLWGEQHLSQVKNAAEREHAKTADEGPWYWFDNAEQDRNERLNNRRDDIVDSTEDEIDDEMKFLMEKQKAGTLTEADVTALMKRKDHESAIEMKYNVNLTNKEGAYDPAFASHADPRYSSKAGQKIAWSDDELTQIESSLAHMPEGHVKDNELLKEIRRDDVNYDDDGKPKWNTGGNHNDGVIRVFETGLLGNYRYSDDTHTLGDPNLVGVDGRPLTKTGDPIGQIEEVVTHEFGHDVHDQNEDAFKKYQEAAGWNQDVDDDQLKAAGISKADIDKLRDEKNPGAPVMGKDGKMYVADPYNDGEVLAYDDGALPKGGNWSYARTNHKDHFAEHYTAAVNAPELVAKELIDDPKTRTTTEQTNRDARQSALDAEKAKKTPDPAKVKQLEADLAAQQKALDDARRDQEAQQKQYDIMRNEIFHADQATNAASDRLRTKGIPAAKLAEFQARAARAQTPQQVELIASEY
jgi:hypothetical protein